MQRSINIIKTTGRGSVSSDGQQPKNLQYSLPPTGTASRRTRWLAAGLVATIVSLSWWLHYPTTHHFGNFLSKGVRHDSPPPVQVVRRYNITVGARWMNLGALLRALTGSRTILLTNANRWGVLERYLRMQWGNAVSDSVCTRRRHRGAERPQRSFWPGIDPLVWHESPKVRPCEHAGSLLAE